MAVLINIEKYAHTTRHKINDGLVYVTINQNKSSINMYSLRAGQKVHAQPDPKLYLQISLQDLGFQSIRYGTDHSAVIQIRTSLDTIQS